MKTRDALFSQPLGDVAEFRFDKSVVDVFPDMLKRSIPGYQSIISQSGLLAARFATANTNLYDLGSSLGATSLSIREALYNDDQSERFAGCQIHAIDNSQAMIDQATRVLTSVGGSSTHIPIFQHCEDMLLAPMHNASVVAMNFTLQFISPDQRADMIQRISDALLPGGVLILSEKVTFDDDALSALHIEMYHNFKKANGYSDLEISQKRTALENVLIPDTLDTHKQRLADAGFARASVWFQCFNFASIVAIKVGISST